MSGFRDIHPRVSVIGWQCFCVPSWQKYTKYHWPPSFAVCWQLHMLGQEITQPVWRPPFYQRCGTVCLNSFGNRTSPLDNLNDRWKRLYLISWATAPCVWTLRAPTRNLLLIYVKSSYSDYFHPSPRPLISGDSIIGFDLQYDPLTM